MEPLSFSMCTQIPHTFLSLSHPQGRLCLGSLTSLLPSGATLGVRGDVKTGARELRRRGPCQVLAVRAAGWAAFHGVGIAGLWDKVTSEGHRNEKSFSCKSVGKTCQTEITAQRKVLSRDRTG